MKMYILTEEERQQARNKFNNLCYVCLNSLEGYESDEIQFDHICAFADGYSPGLYGYAPVHASTRSGMKNCYQDRGRKSPYETYLVT